MKWWVRVQGQNFVIRNGAQADAADFSITRTVWALNPAQASVIAVKGALRQLHAESHGPLDVSVRRARLLESCRPHCELHWRRDSEKIF